MSRPTMLQVMMQTARVVSERSTCARAQVGVVIADRGLRQILSFGYNGNWAGGPNECDGPCVGACGCIHAEENALIKLSSSDMDLRLFTTMSPCFACAKRIVNQQRITHVYFASVYRDQAGLELLHTAGLQVDILNVASLS